MIAARRGLVFLDPAVLSPSAAVYSFEGLSGAAYEHEAGSTCNRVDADSSGEPATHGTCAM